MTRFTKFLAIFCVVLLAAFATQADEQPLKLELAISEAEPLLLTPFYFSATLTNVSDKPVHLVEGTIGFIGCGGADYKIMKDGVHQPDFRIRADCAPPGPNILKPREKQVVTHSFVTGTPYGETGVFEIHISYQSRGKHGSEKYWKGHLTTSKAFKVIAPVGADKAALDYLVGGANEGMVKYEKKYKLWKKRKGTESEIALIKKKDAWRELTLFLKSGKTQLPELFPDSVYALFATIHCRICHLPSPWEAILREATIRFNGKYLFYAYEWMSTQLHRDRLTHLDNALKNTQNPVIQQHYQVQIKRILDNKRREEERAKNPPPPPPSPKEPFPEDTPGLTRPILIKDADYVYPEIAKRMGVEGEVQLLITINDGGDVEDIQVVKDGPLGMTESAMKSIKQRKYAPATYKGKPVSSTLTVRITFEIAE